MKYTTPRALEQAVKTAASKSGADTNKAISRFYHDRFLCRVFAADEPAFVLKGGQSMLAKIPSARETRDVYLLGRTSDLDEALAELKRAAASSYFCRRPDSKVATFRGPHCHIPVIPGLWLSNNA